jgi:hypothetical protein
MSNTKNNETMWRTEVTHEGMTMRDHFAAKVMAAFIHAEQHAALTKTKDQLMLNEEVGGGGVDSYIFYAMEAYDAADAMLKARVLLPSDAE